MLLLLLRTVRQPKISGDSCLLYPAAIETQQQQELQQQLLVWIPVDCYNNYQQKRPIHHGREHSMLLVMLSLSGV